MSDSDRETWLKLQSDLAAFRTITDVLGPRMKQADGYNRDADAILDAIARSAGYVRKTLNGRRAEIRKRKKEEPVERAKRRLRRDAQAAVGAWMPRKSRDIEVGVRYQADSDEHAIFVDFKWRRMILNRGLAVVSDCFVLAIHEEWAAPEGHSECKVVYLDRKLVRHTGWLVHRDGKLASIGKTQAGVRRAGGRKTVAHVKDVMMGRVHEES